MPEAIRPLLTERDAELNSGERVRWAKWRRNGYDGPSVLVGEKGVYRAY